MEHTRFRIRHWGVVGHSTDAAHRAADLIMSVVATFAVVGRRERFLAVLVVPIGKPMLTRVA